MAQRGFQHRLVWFPSSFSWGCWTWHFKCPPSTAISPLCLVGSREHGWKKGARVPDGCSCSSLKLHSPCLWSEHSSGRPGSDEIDRPCDHRFYLLPSQKSREWTWTVKTWVQVLIESELSVIAWTDKSLGLSFLNNNPGLDYRIVVWVRKICNWPRIMRRVREPGV